MRLSLFPALLAAIVLSVTAPASAAVNYRCSQSAIDINEAAGPLAIEAVRDGDLNVDAEALISVQERLSPNRWTQIRFFSVPFARGADRVSVSLPIDDSEYIGTRTLLAHCGGQLVPPGNAGSTTGSMDITIRDDEPFPTIHRSDIVVNESDASPISVPFTLDGTFGRMTTLNTYGFNVTTTWNDYGLFPEMIVHAHAPGGGLLIYIANDQLPEPDETFRVEIREGSTIRKEFLVTIVDDDTAPYPVSFDKSGYDFVEGGTNSVTITRGGDTGQPASGTLHIDAKSPGVWPADVAVHFAAGQTSQTIFLPFNDHAFGGNRIAMLQFIAANRFVSAKAPVTLTDDDPMPVVSIAATDVNEGKNGETRHAEVTLTLNAALSVDLSFHVITVNGTASSATDYVHFDKRVIFPAGALSQKVSIPIRGDDELEPDEILRVEIRHCCDSLALIGTRDATITIRNDDDGVPHPEEPEYQFEQPMRTSWNESDTWLTAAVVRSGVTDRATTVRVELVANRPFAPQEVRFRAGETRKVVRFYLDDAMYSRTRSYGSALDLFSGTTRLDREFVTIADNETKPVITFEDVEVTEGTDDRAVAFVLNIAPASAEPIEAKLLLSEYSYDANITADFAGIRNGQRVIIPAGATVVTIPFHVVGDNKLEGLEEFGLNLRDVNTALATVQGSATCTVHDDDTPGASLTLPASLARGATATATLTLRLAADADETFNISTTTPGLISVPASVVIRGGHKTATFDLTALGSGDAAISVTLSKRLKNLTISEPLFVYTLVTPVVPERVRVPVGTTMPVRIGFSPFADGAVQVSARTEDASIAGVEFSAALAADGGTIAIHGVAIGSTTITIALPAELGGTTLALPVEVYVPGPGKGRAARH